MIENPRLSAGPPSDMGKGFALRQQRDAGTGVLIGYSITGPAGPACKKSGLCGALCPVVPVRFENDRKPRCVWRNTGTEDRPTLSPSVACDCGAQHSHVVDGRWQ